jgi:hypothetical protein
MRLLIPLVAGLMALGVPLQTAEPALVLTIDAGPRDHHDVDVTVAMPAGTAPGAYTASRPGTTPLPVQVDDRGVAHALIPNLHQGERQRFDLAPAGVVSAPTLRTVTVGDVLTVDEDGKTLCSYQGGAGILPDGYDPAFRRGGYLSQIITPGGTLVTDDYPPNHKHHHGVWFSWTKTTFDGRTPDFWNMGNKTGTVEALTRSPAWLGAYWAGFHATHRYRDLSCTPAVTVLDETWDVTIQAPHGPHPVLVIDVVVSQRCATEKPLGFPVYHYGGIGVRGNRAWDGKDNLQVLTADGATRVDANETRSRWCAIGGQVSGQTAGIAVFCHPSNVRSPQPMRVHPTEPFFCYAPAQAGPWSIEPGQPLILRYRLVAYDGPADAADLDRRWSEWAEPPTATITHE